MERRNLVVTPKLAQKLYNSGNPTLREIAVLSVGTANLRTYGRWYTIWYKTIIIRVLYITIEYPINFK